jgi:hypothetical protein
MHHTKPQNQIVLELSEGVSPNGARHRHRCRCRFFRYPISIANYDKEPLAKNAKNAKNEKKGITQSREGTKFTKKIRWITNLVLVLSEAACPP